MTIEQLREHLQTKPFRPFVINTADGRQFPVEHPELLARSFSGRTINVQMRGDRSATIDLLLVASIEPKSANGQHTRRRRATR